MRNTTLLILAMIVTVTIYMPLLIRGTVMRKGAEVGEFHFKIANDLDELWCLLIWGIEDHTVSAMVFAKGKAWAIELIDWLFQDENHCYKAWKEEFNIKANNDN